MAPWENLNDKPTKVPRKRSIGTPHGALEWFEHLGGGTSAGKLIRTRPRLANRSITVAELEELLAEMERGPFD